MPSRLRKKFLDAGLYLNFQPILAIAPPLNITKDEIGEMVSIMDRVIGEIEGELSIS